jgi:DNA replication protein DnaC
MMQEERNYLELKIPISQYAEWLSNLCDAMAKEGIYVKWQNGWYHITVMFIYDNKHVKELQSAFDKMLDNHEVPVMVLDEESSLQEEDTNMLCI